MTENECIKSLNGIYPEWCSEKEEYEMAQVAIQALTEIQSYRAIGTVEELIHSNAKALVEQVELEKYKAIGTIEEFKALKEKNEPKKIVYQVGKNGLKHEKCPTCGSFHVFGRYCSECGQKLDWGNE